MGSTVLGERKGKEFLGRRRNSRPQWSPVLKPDGCLFEERAKKLELKVSYYFPIVLAVDF